MSFWKKSLIVAGAAVAMIAAPVMAELEIKPYGAAQYRLRFEHGMHMPDEGDDLSTFDYSNRLCLRVGLRAKIDEQFSMQFQIGNNWGAAENVNWSSNRNGGNLYMQLAFFRWNPGAFFVEAGIVPLSGNGALDLIERSAGTMGPGSAEAGGRYAGANFSGWGDMNSSLVGLKLGMPLLKGDVKIGAELTQSVTANRTQSFSDIDSDGEVRANPAGIITVLQIPVSAGAFKITPEVVVVINKDTLTVNDYRETDHEMAFGAAGSYKVSDDVTVTFRGGYAMYSNENRTGEGPTTDKPSGLLIGAGTSVKAGPGTLQFALDYNAVDNDGEGVENADYSYIYTDLRYAMKLHPRVTFTPRYRTYTRMFPNDDMRLHNRFELIIEGSF